MVSEARLGARWLDTARSQRPAFAEVSPARIGGQVAEEVPDVLAGAARPVGLRTDGRLRLNHPTKSTAAIVVNRRCFIFLQLSILHTSCRRVCGCVRGVLVALVFIGLNHRKIRPGQF